MSTITVTNIKATGETASRAVSGVAAAWAFADGTGAASISDSQGISGLVDNGTGDYTFSFSNSMSNATYGGGSAAASSQANGQNFQLHIFATSSIRTRAENASGTLTDCSRLVFNIHGDLA